MAPSRCLLARRPSSVRLRLLAEDLIRKGIVRPAGVDGSVGAAHASSENHSSIDTAEATFGIISDVWMDRAVHEFKAQKSSESQSSSRTRGVMQVREKEQKVRNGGTSGTAVCYVPRNTRRTIMYGYLAHSKLRTPACAAHRPRLGI
jgi:hypothetical protein